MRSLCVRREGLRRARRERKKGARHTFCGNSFHNYFKWEILLRNILGMRSLTFIPGPSLSVTDLFSRSLSRGRTASVVHQEASSSINQEHAEGSPKRNVESSTPKRRTSLGAIMEKSDISHIGNEIAGFSRHPAQYNVKHGSRVNAGKSSFQANLIFLNPFEEWVLEAGNAVRVTHERDRRLNVAIRKQDKKRTFLSTWTDIHHTFAITLLRKVLTFPLFLCSHSSNRARDISGNESQRPVLDLVC